jgi:hypothetical protein
MKPKTVFAGLVVVMTIGLTAQAAPSREEEARKAFTETVVEFNKAACGNIRIYYLKIFIQSLGTKPITKSERHCLNAYRRAAKSFDHIVETFPETQVAFTVLNEGYPTTAEIEPAITKILEARKSPDLPSPDITDMRPSRRPTPQNEDFLQSVLRDVSPEERGEKQEEKKEKKEERPPPAKKQVQNRAPLDAVATMSEIDAIRHKIEGCWAIPAGAREADKLVVSIRVWVNPDGTVRDARILDQARLSEAFFRKAAESALRAVLNPRCSPLPIPINKYEQFKEMVLDFNPKLATGL